MEAESSKGFEKQGFECASKPQHRPVRLQRRRLGKPSWHFQNGGYSCGPYFTSTDFKTPSQHPSPTAPVRGNEDIVDEMHKTIQNRQHFCKIRNILQNIE
ncbi:hypothetical protein AOXY_G21891 [Acipenser oxyrinchus oxyrinchus]|uniref:Uncharacterized protein n=1 Tax=Acipenser oxyrinchus oxyrinchus TaxID=40147 RepID=A0AAD8FX36_ACIOX|nr:hypothetical protein AOXY_G21891 [Acipenser oxyrinchus oxyrinchus]